jgi:hypothetical protein
MRFICTDSFFDAQKMKLPLPEKYPIVGAVNLIKSCYIILKTTLLHTTTIRPSSGTNLMKIGGVLKKWHALEFGGSKFKMAPVS